MAKKVRFPLEMDHGVEVRSIDELKDNFSLSRVLGYVADGKLITWLKDRYADDLADEIAKLDKDDVNLAEKVCRIFDVPFNENAADEIEKAEERNRKMGLLRGYPDCMEYSGQVDSMAFDQDDLYDLLDEGIAEIYLCGARFSIPVVKQNVKYIGILKDVTVCIDSKTPIDFAVKNIRFENCIFDAKYQEILSTAEKEEENEKSDVEVIETGDNSEVDIDPSEIEDVIKDLKEILSEFADSEYENEDDYLYEYDGSIECYGSDYDCDWYENKARAKAACKEALALAIEDTKSLFESAKKELVDCTETYYESIKYEVPAFVENIFLDSIDALVNAYCSDETKRYVLEKKKVFEKLVIDTWRDQIISECEKQFEKLVDDSFKKVTRKVIFREETINVDNVLNIRRLFDMCKYEDDGDGNYEFIMEDACADMVEGLTAVIEKETEAFPEKVKAAFMGIRAEYVSKIAQWIEALRIKG